MLTFEQIKELLELVGRHQLEGLEIERSGFRLSIAGKADGARLEVPPALPPTAVPAGSTGAAPSSTSPQAVAGPVGPAAAPQAPAPATDEGLHVVRSPIVGTFYQAPSPDAEPFVRVGDRVRKGQVLCIVEAMKLMNEIESDMAGIVVEVYPSNGQPVEYGEAMFSIRPG